mgnify:CR=1 FL=1
MKHMLLTIADDIVRFFFDYAETGAKLAGVAVIIYWCVVLVWRVCLEKTEPRLAIVGVKSIFLFMLVMYVYIVIGITVLSRSESQNSYAFFELFRTFQNTFFAKKQICENILLLMPYSVLLFGMSSKMRNGWLMFGAGLISSLAIEITQLVTYTGYFEIDDIWTNVLGMMLGYFGCTMVRWIYRLLR